MPRIRKGQRGEPAIRKKKLSKLRVQYHSQFKKMILTFSPLYLIALQRASNMGVQRINVCACVYILQFSYRKRTYKIRCD